MQPAKWEENRVLRLPRWFATSTEAEGREAVAACGREWGMKRVTGAGLSLLDGGTGLPGQRSSTCKASPLFLPLAGFSLWGTLHLPGLMVFSLSLNCSVSSKFSISPFASLFLLYHTVGGFWSLPYSSLWGVF